MDLDSFHQRYSDELENNIFLEIFFKLYNDKKESWKSAVFKNLFLEKFKT